MKRLKEIERIDSIPNKEVNYDKFVDKNAKIASAFKTKSESKIDSIDIKWYDCGKIQRIISYNNDNPIGYLALKKFRDGYQVYTLGVKPEARRAGLAEKMYDFVLSKTKLYSDHQQTPESRKLWIKLSRKYKVTGFDELDDSLFAVKPNGDEFESLDKDKQVYSDNSLDGKLLVMKESKKSQNIFENWKRFIKEKI